MKRFWSKLWLLMLVAWVPLCGAIAQAAEPDSDLRSLMRGVCAYQIQMLQRQDTRLRYRIRRVDHKGTSVRELIESHDGSVTRLLQRDGQPLTPELDGGEQKRLQGLIGTSKMRDREHDEDKSRAYGVELLQVMPTAMRFALAPQQSPLPDVAAKQVVVDFAPDPNFRPSGMAQQILTSVAGRLWISEADHRLLRMEMHNTADVNLAWGILAKVYTGGTLSYDQRPFQDLYSYTHIVMHLKVRELMLKTQSMDVDTTASDFQRLPQSPSGDDAIRTLLAIPVPTH